MYDADMRNEGSSQPERDTRLTYDDFLLFPDDGRRHELIDGEHYVTPSPNTRHQMLVGRLHFEISSCGRADPGETRLARITAPAWTRHLPRRAVRSALIEMGSDPIFDAITIS